MNPVVDQERADFLAARIADAKRQLLPQWMRPEKELPVVSLPIEWVRFSTLNHRTRAEQMREIEKSGVADLFSGDPMGPAAQEAQLKILSSQEGFEALKQDLRERGQQEPAVVTAEGVLINGNRRSAGLRDLWLNEHLPSARYIRAYVLPGDTTADELVDLETELQVAKDYREEYSWVNEAILIEEIFEASNKDWDRVAQRMRLKPAEVRAQYEKLQQLHQLVAMSNGTRYHADFVGNESAFEELSKHVKDKQPEEARSVRSVYFLGTLSGVNYRDLRHLRRKDASAFVRGEFAIDPTLTSLLSVAGGGANKSTDDLLDEVLGEDSSYSPADLTSVLSFLARRKPEEIVEMPDGTKLPVEELLASVRSAVNSAAKEASEEAKDAQVVVAPIVRLSAALDDILRAAAALAKARAQNSWDEHGFK
ncbi:ParB/RepB/Spo0J family partition protein, partial [Mesorhizobium sp. M6A.T.Ce.TU.016.01.1.1]|uniref:ParB/RepB/Spo0J family partition protein n=1 Tax=Mesorhizobium sp. M6A.T.Ce.TU.016.01.1.1 TaxID=2496783 RepID=UPI000FD2E647